MTEKKRFSLLPFLAFLTFLCLLASLFFGLSAKAYRKVSPTQSDPARPMVVVLDAGHGGEDGGAVSASGIYEKDLNLAIAKKLEALLTANGIRVVMTRTDDRLLYDPNSDYHGRKKVLDLAARRRIAEETEGCVFVSIHMNAYPQESSSGLQVWYSRNHESSHMLAQHVQELVRQELQPDNHRRIKAATSSIYLLHHLHCPAVLIECGFLSNAREAALLASEDYQDRLARLLFLSILQASEELA
ncbi:MAG: N-acetylmuramoyl-L-alanine amidase [Clostridia bacterium]|nr:N-acetylmuramoyl-L-alanine amidase [Clostridia bacterium]